MITTEMISHVVEYETFNCFRRVYDKSGSPKGVTEKLQRVLHVLSLALGSIWKAVVDVSCTRQRVE